MVVLRSPGGANHDRAIYEIPIVKAILKNKSSKKSISDQSDLRSNEPENRDQNDLTSEINLISNKEIENKREKKSLSPSLEKYFENCFPSAKREREWGYFQKLSEEFPINDISLSLVWLLNNGIPNSKEPCHSPMNFLSHGIGQVLSAAKEEEHKFKHREQLENEKRQAEEAERTAVARDTERFEAAKKALAETYPNAGERQQFLSEQTNQILKGCPLPPKIAERLAIVEWYQGRATV